MAYRFRIRTAILLVSLAGTGTAGLAQNAPIRVDIAVALKQVIKKVDPVWTQDLVDANPGALLAADVIVNAGGAVEVVSILVGPGTLRPAFVAAVKQWTFKPFFSGGRPARAVVMIDYQLRNPKEEQFVKASNDYREAFEQCERRIEGRASDAVVLCQRAVQLSENLAPERRLERSHAASKFGAALFIADRPADALVQFDKTLSYRRRMGEMDSDADNATLLVMVARAHSAMRDLPKADAALSEAAATLRRAIIAVPAFKTRYSQLLDDVFREHADLKAVMGKVDDVKALQTAATELNAPARGLPMPPMTRDGNLQIGGTIGPRLNAHDLRQIRALLPAGKTPWLLFGNGEDDVRWYVDVFLQPDAVTRTFRRGQVVTLLGRVVASGDAKPTRAWEVPGFPWSFVQVPLAGRDMDEIRRTDDLNRPVTIALTAGEPMTDDEVVSLITFLRAAAARSAGTPSANDLRATVQRWPIAHVLRWPDGRVDATLREASTVDGPSQLVTLRREGPTWVIVKLDPR